MKILLTGAGGFTGRHFEAIAKAGGHEIIALKADLMDSISLANEVAAVNPEAVIHLAGISFVGNKDDSAFYAVNVVGTTHLLSALAALPTPPQKVLLASSANVYGNCQASPIQEYQLPEPVNHYAMSKLAMEYMARLWIDRLPIVIARPFNYTGVGQAPQFLLPKIVDHFRRRERVIELGNLDVERDFSDVRMVANAYRRLIELAPAGEVFNVCSGEACSLKDVLSMMAEIAGYEIEVKINPTFVRANELKRLQGSCKKLESVIGPVERISLHETLCWMFEKGGG